MHDDQHGTAIVVLAGLINAAKVAKKKFSTLRVVVAGAGAAGTGVAKLLLASGITDIIMVDRNGALSPSRSDLNNEKVELAKITNPRQAEGPLSDVLVGADVFIGVSGPDILTKDMVSVMAPRAIVFALSNPVPEIMPEEAKKGGALVIATGRSDFPNQINNALVFPGIFRGALDKKLTKITTETKLRAAKALASLVATPTAKKIMPDILDKRVAPAIARAVK